MATPKLISTLEILTPDEWVSFKKYLLMYTRVESDNFSCFLLFQKNKKKLSKEGLDDELRKEHFPQMSPKVFSNMLSRLFGWFEDWLAVDTFKKQEFEKKLMLVRTYNQRGLFKLADYHFHKVETEITKVNSSDLKHPSVLARLYYYQYYSNNPIKRQKNRIFLKDFLDKYLTNMTEQSLSLLMELENSNKVSEDDYEILRTIVQQLQEVSPATKLSKILNLAIQMLRDRDLEAVNKLKDILETGELEESSDLFMILSIYLRKTVARLWNLGQLKNPILLADACTLTFHAIEKNSNQKFLTTNLFNGVDTLGALLSYEKTDDFISKWIDKVHTIDRVSALRYCKALNAFRHEKYDMVPKLLTSLVFDKINYQVISASILIISFYKLGEENLVVTLSQNLKKQLKRQKNVITSFEYYGLNNLISIILLLQKSKYDRKIKFNIEQYNPLYYRSWVMKELKSE